MVKVAVLDDWQGVARSSADWSALERRAEVEFFETAFADEDEAAERLQPFDIVMAMRERTPFPPTLVGRLPNLRMFNLTGRRAASVDIEGMQDRGVTVSCTEGGRGGEATAELALALMLASARRLPAADAAMRDGRFQEGVGPGRMLAGLTLGVIGLGRIGSRVAGYGRALGMDVLAWSRNLTAQTAAAAGATAVGKDELLARADVVSLHLVLSERSRHVIAAADLERMKRGALLINTSRGPLVDEAALVAALEAGHIHAALDVYDREPLPTDHPLRHTPNTLLTPHLGYVVDEVFELFYRQSIENVLAFLDGAPIRVME